MGVIEYAVSEARPERGQDTGEGARPAGHPEARPVSRLEGAQVRRARGHAGVQARGRGRRRAALAALGLLLAAAGLATPTGPGALAQGAVLGSAEMKARQAALLQASLADPANLDAAFEYAMVSAQVGDYEAAISTLERMLVFAPGLPRVQLELGVLYLRLGAEDVAATYFESALAAPNVPPQVAERVETYLAAIARKEAPAKVSGMLTTGVRVQSNANASPEGRRIQLNGTTFLLDDTATGKSDVNGFLSGNVNFSYDLGLQGDSLEADLVFYGARYGRLDRLNTEMAELTAGPTLNLARFGIDDARLGLYGIVNGIRLDGANYSAGVGAGLRLGMRVREKDEINARLEVRRRWFNDTARYPTASDRAGYAVRAVATYHHRFTAAFTGRLSVMADYEDARVGWKTSLEGGVSAGLTYRFASPFGGEAGPWSIDLEAGYTRRGFSRPDPLVNRSRSQRDNEAWLRSVLTMPVGGRGTAVALTGELRRQQSTYDLNDYTNALGMVTLMQRF
ncbi:hypothetical protein GWI72_10250 [Microvirga tunisiensis]|uniref:Tetratricopeptide repeat protein n=1 Tax=Pannonibacter tanglangensis TaxID=2750084 RepID=A0A7X5J8L8_9HYPH|nr:hypothetical protein [Pannonibacter sp. XCT-53]NBN78647.1 hypothetical protein [Pannonibacter sp. XCT-53]